ncbi:thermonuclease family protein [Rhizobium gallicum]|uniref:thermonuclease family protein n=1 Tax=Rhizobium gallicum TaxID=56730 RepID=UPI001EF796BA|nr:thermonuclease family protein [Rhizobium gallicum]ULJ75900.1 thermonuclease family protein [Rhizobium gallicum]
MRNLAASLMVVSGLGSFEAAGADVPHDDRDINRPAIVTLQPAIRGRVSIISGDTLWFPEFGRRVHLEGIDACALPQWTFDPSIKQAASSPAPVPCGPLAMAWLKRVVGTAIVTCQPISHLGPDDLSARCSARGHDLGLEMLRVGWARIGLKGFANSQYIAAQRHARSARYGLWVTYALGMDEWQRKAIDRTTKRRPLADWNLLSDREQEITPPFADWRNRPRRTDR